MDGWERWMTLADAGRRPGSGQRLGWRHVVFAAARRGVSNEDPDLLPPVDRPTTSQSTVRWSAQVQAQAQDRSCVVSSSSSRCRPVHKSLPPSDLTLSLCPCPGIAAVYTPTQPPRHRPRHTLQRHHAAR